MIDLRLSRVSARLRALGSGRLPGALAAPIRSALGPALRKVGCTAARPCTSGCAHPEDCPFGMAFAPLPARPGWGGTPPRPFWLQHNSATPRSLRRGDELEFAVVATPAMAKHIDAVLGALSLAAAEGIAGVRFALRERGEELAHSLEDAAVQSASWGSSLAVRFTTPLRLKENGRLLTQGPSLPSLVSALTRRANALAAIYAGVPWDRGLGTVVEAAGRARCVLDQTHWLGILRRRRGQHPDSLSGLTGQLFFDQVDATVAPWLAFGDVLHAGADTVFGCGRLQAGPQPYQLLEPGSLELVACLAAQLIREESSAPVAIAFAGGDWLTVHLPAPCSQALRDRIADLGEDLGVTIELVADH